VVLHFFGHNFFKALIKYSSRHQLKAAEIGVSQVIKELHRRALTVGSLRDTGWIMANCLNCCALFELLCPV